MARGRMLNRKIAIDSAVAELVNEHSPAHGLVFTWMIAHLDRDGRMVSDPRAVKGIVAPLLDDIGPGVVSETIDAAAVLGLIDRYEDDRGRQFLVFPKFPENQAGLRYSREPVSDFPDPELCRKVSGTLPEDIRKASGSDPEGVRHKGIEGKVIEEKGKEEKVTMSRSLRARDHVGSGIVDDIWSHYRRWHPKAAKKIGDKNAKLCRARLAEGFTPDDLKQAIDGYHRSPFHCGVNDRNLKYQTWELIMRDQDHTQKGVEMVAQADAPVLSERTQRSATAGQRWIKRMEENDQE